MKVRLGLFALTALAALIGVSIWAWVAYKENLWTSRVTWLVIILTLGNMAMATYVLIQLARLPANAKIEDLLLRRG